MKNLSRRDFLKASWLLASSLVLSNCSQEESLTQATAQETPPLDTPTPTLIPTSPVVLSPPQQPVSLPNLGRYYLGYAIEENMNWITEFDVEVLSRAFLLFLNANNRWLVDYQPRLDKLRERGMMILVAIQAAVLVENIRFIPELAGDDPAMAFPQELIPERESYACRTPDGQTIGENFAHACLNNASFGPQSRSDCR